MDTLSPNQGLWWQAFWTLKQKWYLAEDLVYEYYRKQGFLLHWKNYTIRGWELDLIMSNDTTWLFVEVKCIDGIDDIHNHIKLSKIKAIQRTIDSYFYLHSQWDKTIMLEFVYVKYGMIYGVYPYEL